MSAVTEAAQALAGLLRTAEEHGLPMPYSAQVSAYAPHGHPDYPENEGGISIAVDRLAELADWAIWLDEPIDSNTKSEESRHHNVYGYAGPIPLNVYALSALADEIGIGSSSHYACSRCGAQFGIAGVSTGSQEDLDAEEDYRAEVEFHELGRCPEVSA